MGKNRCPNCGKRAPEGVLCCPKCGYSIHMAVAQPAEEFDYDLETDDEGIEDPDLLELAESHVRALPLRGNARTDGLSDGTWDHYRPELSGEVLESAESGEKSRAEEVEDAVSIGGECPQCGRQAQRGWPTCPWCGSPLPG